CPAAGRTSRKAHAARRTRTRSLPKPRGDPQGLRAQAVDVDGQVAWAAQHRVLPVGRWVLDQAGVVEPAGQFGQCDLCLQTGQRRPETTVDAAAEAEVLDVPPVRVEPVGVREALRVPVARGQDEPDLRALRYRDPAYLDVRDAGPLWHEL